MEPPSSVEIQFRLHATSKTGGQEAADAPSLKPGRLPRVTRVLALAIQCQEMIRAGEVRDCADLARLGGLSRERISQMMRLLWLAPDIQVEVLYFPAMSGSHFPIHERAVRNISNKYCWNEQRDLWAKLKQTHHLL